MSSSFKFRCSCRRKGGGPKEKCGKPLTVLMRDADFIYLQCPDGHGTRYTAWYMNRFSQFDLTDEKGQIVVPDCCPACSVQMNVSALQKKDKNTVIQCGSCQQYFCWHLIRK